VTFRKWKFYWKPRWGNARSHKHLPTKSCFFDCSELTYVGYYSIDGVVFAIAFRCALDLTRRKKMFRLGDGHGRSQDFVLSRRRKFRPEGPNSERGPQGWERGGVLGRVHPAPSPPARESGSAVSTPSADNRVLRVLNVQIGLSGQLVLFIVPCKGRIFLVLVILEVYWYNFHSSNLFQGIFSVHWGGCLNGRYTALAEGSEWPE